MYVCLCTGTTCESVIDAVAAGATTPRQVIDSCGVGRDCGRCLRHVKELVDAAARPGQDLPRWNSASASALACAPISSAK